MMSRFRKRPEVVEAVQWHPGRGEMPGVVVGPVSPFRYAWTDAGRVRLEAGDWLVWQAGSERPMVVPDDEFAAAYEVAE